METKIVRNPVKIKQQLGMFAAEVSALRLFQGYFWNECCVTNLTVTSTVYQPRARPQPQQILATFQLNSFVHLETSAFGISES